MTELNQNQDQQTGKEGVQEEISHDTFSDWIKEQPPAVQELYSKEVASLKGALDMERQSRKKANETVANLKILVEKGSDAETKLTELQSNFETLQKKADMDAKRAAFAEQAIQPAVGCTNIKTAFALALTENLFDKDGNPDWVELKKNAPELFKVGSTDAGRGTGNEISDYSINAAIREAAQR